MCAEFAIQVNSASSTESSASNTMASVDPGDEVRMSRLDACTAFYNLLPTQANQRKCLRQDSSPTAPRRSARTRKTSKRLTSPVGIFRSFRDMFHRLIPAGSCPRERSKSSES